jgi:glycosyltransferase involved in cell wall biosynthesis
LYHSAALRANGGGTAGATRRFAARVRDGAKNKTRYLRRGGLREVIPPALAGIVGGRPWRVLRFETLAFIVGDHATATRVARRRRDEQALFVGLAAEWELGDERAACARAEELLDGDPRCRRAVARFYQYLEHPAEATRALERIGGAVDGDLRIDLALLWSRHGHPDRALALLETMIAGGRRGRRALDHRERIAGEAAVLGRSSNGSLPAPASAERDRVLHMVSRSLPHHHAGATYRTHYTVGAQIRAGIDARVVTECGFPAGASARAEQYDHVPYHRLPPIPQGPRLDERVSRHVEAATPLVGELRPGVIHCHSDYLNATVALGLRERFGIPVVYEVRGFPEEYLPRRPGSRVLFERWGTRRAIEAECWRSADRVVTLAEVMKRHIASKGVDPDRIFVVPNAVDASRFAPVERDPALAARLGIAEGELVIGYVTSFHVYEGMPYLIEAVARLARAGRPVRCLLVGDGAERAYLTALAERLKVRDRIIFTGRIDHAELASYYGLIDVFVVPRTAEATTDLVTPLKPFEAMAMAKPVVVSGTAALREVVDDGRAGLAFEPEDVESLVETLEPLLDDAAHRAALGERAREWVAENRTWARNADRYREVYASLGALR